MPRPARCHPNQNHWAKELCRECFNLSQRKTPIRWSPESLERRRKKNAPPLPRKHPLAADLTLHKELIKTGVSWLACEQMRDLRKQGASLASIANFYQVPSTLVALASSWTDLSKVVVEEGDINRARPRRPWHPADAVHFGRHYEDGDAY